MLSPHLSASAHLSTSTKPTSDTNVIDEEESDTESSDSDGFWEQIRTEGSRRPAVDVYADDLSHTVTSLCVPQPAIETISRFSDKNGGSVDTSCLWFFKIQRTVIGPVKPPV